jgi:predicted oxidoreductase
MSTPASSFGLHQPFGAHAPGAQRQEGGLMLSEVVAGAWHLADWGWSIAQRQAWIEGCLSMGLTSFDHADVYGDYQTEPMFGQVLSKAPGLRHRMQLVSKCGVRQISSHRPEHRQKSYDTSAAHITASVETSLRSLHTDHLDLLLIHRPDPLMDADDVARCFERLHQAGKVRHFGVANFTPRQFELLHSRFPLETNQVECSPLNLNVLHDGTLDQMQHLRLRPMVWSPLGGGRLFSETDPVAARVRPVMLAMAEQKGITLTTLALAWLMRHPSRPRPVIGTRRINVAQEAMDAVQLRLDAAEWYRIWEAGAGHEVA